MKSNCNFTYRLKSRHIQFIALGGTIGTGLFLGIGSALTRAGPLSMLLGYSITGIAIFAMMQCLGEMATWLPLPGAIPQFAARYVDDALGFAVGWNVSWFTMSHIFVMQLRAGVLEIYKPRIICSAPEFMSSCWSWWPNRTGILPRLPCVRKFQLLLSSFNTGREQCISMSPHGLV